MSIAIDHISKRFGAYQALDDVSLEVPTGELVALLGPSGCGKTTLLRVIAGLESADSGRVLFDGVDATERHVRERGVGFVFQHYALFRHMSVFDNVAFGLSVLPRRQRPHRAEIRRRVEGLLELVQLGYVANRLPGQLSGGQRQRVALARALAVQPRVLLLDEPFGALDATVRKELRRWLRRLHEELHVTSVFVTHDQEEAMEVASRVVVMSRGRVEQVGRPEEVYDRPATPFVARFLGDVNYFDLAPGEAQVLALAGGGWGGAPMERGASVAYVRPHDLLLRRSAGDGGAVPATVREVRPLGPTVRISLQRAGDQGEVEAAVSRDRFRAEPVEPGDLVYLQPLAAHVFPADPVAPQPGAN